MLVSVLPTVQYPEVQSLINAIKPLGFYFLFSVVFPKGKFVFVCFHYIDEKFCLSLDMGKTVYKQK